MSYKPERGRLAISSARSRRNSPGTLQLERQFSLRLASQFLYGLGDWVYSLAVVVLAYHLGGGLAAAAAVLLLQAGGRLLAVTFGAQLRLAARPRALIPVFELLRAGLIAALIFVTSRDQLWVAMSVAMLLGLLGPVIESARHANLTRHRCPEEAHSLRARCVRRWDQLAMIAGSISGGALIVLWSEQPAFVLAALASLAATLFAVASGALRPVNGGRQPAAPAGGEPTDGSPGAVRVLLLALAGGAALGISIRVLLIDIVLDEHAGTELIYGLFIALAGVGAFAGPLAVPRLLGKLPSEFVLGGVTAALAVALMAAHLADPLALAIPVIIGCGVLAITAERAGETVVRRLIPDRELDRALHLLATTTIAGQVVALAVVAGLGYLSNVTAIVVSLIVMSTVCAALPILMYIRGGSRSAVSGGD